MREFEPKFGFQSVSRDKKETPSSFTPENLKSEDVIFRNKQECKDIQELVNAQLNAIVDAASKIYQLNENKPVRILDLATGPNDFNPGVVKALVKKGIDYELVLSDISPTLMKIGYKNLERTLTAEELKKVKVVLVDSNNLKKQHKKIPLYPEEDQPFKPTRKALKKVLQDPEFYFLSSGYEGTNRKEKFTSESFDLLIGNVPYGSMLDSSMQKERCAEAVDESIRVLRKGGYHIVWERQVEMNEDAKRNLRILATLKGTKFAARVENTKFRHAENIAKKLNNKLKPIVSYSCKQVWKREEPSTSIRKGDVLKEVVLVHQKKD